MTITTLIIDNTLCAELEAEARAEFPRECCGLIEGEQAGEQVRAMALHPSSNLAPEPDRFAIDPKLQFALLRRLRNTGRRVIGCYHSHPNGRAEPSPRDAEAAEETGFVWLILAVASPEADAELAAYIHRKDGFAPIRIDRRLLDRSAPPPV